MAVRLRKDVTGTRFYVHEAEKNRSKTFQNRSREIPAITEALALCGIYFARNPKTSKNLE